MATYRFRCPECDPRVAVLLADAARTCVVGGRVVRRRPALVRTGQGLGRHRLREEASRDARVVAAAFAPTSRRRPSSALRPTALPLL